MLTSKGWSRILVIAGLVATLAGALDPLEGSIVILLGTSLLALAAWIGGSQHRRLLYWSFALVAVGVGALWGMSALGGVGGPTGRSMWWLLVLAPYPVGWVMAVIGAVRQLRGTRRPAASPTV